MQEQCKKRAILEKEKEQERMTMAEMFVEAGVWNTAQACVVQSLWVRNLAQQ